MNNFFKNFLLLIFSIFVCELAGVVGGLVTYSSIASGWYAGLVKPLFSPPNWVFGPVWTLLYFLMGVSLFLVVKSHKQYPYKLEFVRVLFVWVAGVIFFFVQLLFNIFWSILFFGMKNPVYAFFDIVLLWIFIIVTIFAFAKISKPAAWLLVPYILWVTFAVYLNLMIVMLN